jgi:hypothetical protein
MTFRQNCLVQFSLECKIQKCNDEIDAQIPEKVIKDRNQKLSQSIKETTLSPTIIVSLISKQFNNLSPISLVANSISQFSLCKGMTIHSARIPLTRFK